MQELSKSHASGWPCLMPNHDLLLWLLLSYSFVPLFPIDIIDLCLESMVVRRRSFRSTKQWAADEERLVWEMERVMDIELFLEGQTLWEEDSPHSLGNDA